MSKKVKQEAADQPQTDATEPVATEPVNDTPAPAQEANGQPKAREPKDLRFQRLAIKRVNKALKVLSHVGNLANKATYSYTDEQAVKIVNTLVDSVNAVRDKFIGNPSKGGGWTL